MVLSIVMEIQKTIGWNIRMFRVKLGMSQEQLSFESGLDRSFVGKIERGSVNITVATMETLAKTLEVHVTQLFDEVDEQAGMPAPMSSGRKNKTKT